MNVLGIDAGGTVVDRAADPRGQVRRLEVEPAAGAVRLALAEARGGARIPGCVS